MQELKQHAWLLSLVALLVIAKFIIMPIFTWQDALLADIGVLTTKQKKISKVLANQHSNKQLGEKLLTTLKPVDGLFFPFQSDTRFKLSQQKMLEELLAEHNLNVGNVGWQVTTDLDMLGVTRYPISIRFTGKTADTINFIAAIERNSRHIEISKLNLTLKGQRGEGIGRINGNVTLRLFMEQSAKVDADTSAQPIVNVRSEIVDKESA
jgi:Tfp pilus assembly protein PilO